MKDIIDKISSYNLFNYLLPGILFAAIGDQITSYTLVHDDLLIAVFLYYFMGLVISRVGSLIIAPLMKCVKFVELASYADFVQAVRADPKIDLLSEQNNMYRTLCAVCLMLALLKGGEVATVKLGITSQWMFSVLLVLLFILFALSYRKQTAFVKKRIDIAKAPTGATNAAGKT